MPDLGDRSRAMGPQPLAPRMAAPSAMLAAADRILALLAEGRRAELTALLVDDAAGAFHELEAAVAPGAYLSHTIVACAKANDHYYVKARLFGPRAAPFTLQLRLGERDGRWMVWEAVNLSGRRTAWTR